MDEAGRDPEGPTGDELMIGCCCWLKSVAAAAGILLLMLDGAADDKRPLLLAAEIGKFGRTFELILKITFTFKANQKIVVVKARAVFVVCTLDDDDGIIVL